MIHLSSGRTRGRVTPLSGKVCTAPLFRIRRVQLVLRDRIARFYSEHRICLLFFGRCAGAYYDAAGQTRRFDGITLDITEWVRAEGKDRTLAEALDAEVQVRTKELAQAEELRDPAGARCLWLRRFACFVGLTESAKARRRINMNAEEQSSNRVVT